jgi:hypothetical protein
MACGKRLAHGMTARALYEQYEGFGDDPFALAGRCHGAPVTFSAWGYIRQNALDRTDV